MRDGLMIEFKLEKSIPPSDPGREFTLNKRDLHPVNPTFGLDSVPFQRFLLAEMSIFYHQLGSSNGR